MCAERKPIISECFFRKFIFSVFQGAFTFQGSMIDMPLLKQAQNIVTLATSIKEKWSGKWGSHQVGGTYTVGFLKTNHNTQGNLWACQIGTFLHLQFMLITITFVVVNALASESSKNELSSFWFQVYDFIVHECVIKCGLTTSQGAKIVGEDWLWGKVRS